jgi:hypothetical protein
MSAYIVSDDHIHALVNFAVSARVSYFVNGKWIDITLENAEEIGQIFADENYRSVHRRYQERTTGHFGKAAPYKFKRARPLSDAVVILKLINCLDYQSCETDDWKASLAFNILAQIKDEAVRKLPGYDAAPWGI